MGDSHASVHKATEYTFEVVNADKKKSLGGCGALIGTRENAFDHDESIIICRPDDFKAKIARMK